MAGALVSVCLAAREAPPDLTSHPPFLEGTTWTDFLLMALFNADQLYQKELRGQGGKTQHVRNLLGPCTTYCVYV